MIYRELDDALGLTEMVEPELMDIRTGRNTQHELVGLLRQSIYSRLGGYPDTNDVERLSIDPAMRHLIGGRAKGLARNKQGNITRTHFRFLDG